MTTIGLIGLPAIEGWQRAVQRNPPSVNREGLFLAPDKLKLIDQQKLNCYPF